MNTRHWSDRLLLASAGVLLLAVGFRSYLALRSDAWLLPQPGTALDLGSLHQIEGIVDSVPADTTIVLVFTTYCSTCRSLMPVWSWLHRTFRNTETKPSYSFVGLTENNVDEVTIFREQYGVEFPIYVDENGRLFRSKDIRTVPEVIWMVDNRVVRALPAEAGTDMLTQEAESLTRASDSGPRRGR